MDDKSDIKLKFNDKPRFNAYHIKYYHDKIKGVKIECECGLMFDKFRVIEHKRTKKHNRSLNLKLSSINI
jgi:hypothetical protein